MNRHFGIGSLGVETRLEISDQKSGSRNQKSGENITDIQIFMWFHDAIV